MPDILICPEGFGLTQPFDDRQALDHVATLVHEAGHATYAHRTGHEVFEKKIWITPKLRSHSGSVKWRANDQTSATNCVLSAVMGPVAGAIWVHGMHHLRGTSTDPWESSQPGTLHGVDMATVQSYLAASDFRDLDQAWSSAHEIAVEIWPNILAEAKRIDCDCDCLTRRSIEVPKPAQHNHHMPTTGTTIPGGTMSSVNEIRAALAASNEQAEHAMGALAQAAQATEQNQGQLAQVTQGSNHAAAQEAIGLYAQVGEAITQVMALFHAARSAVDNYAASL